MNIKKFILLICMSGTIACQKQEPCPVTASETDLSFTELTDRWDEGIPLGNATIGALVWQKDSAMRFSLDRTDLWDLRPTDSLSGDNYRFAWVKEHIQKKDYLPVQQKFDHPYDMLPAPSKIPGAALEFSLAGLGCPSQVRLYTKNALCEVQWPDGTLMQTFVHATAPVGWFFFKNLKSDVNISLVPPMYNSEGYNGIASPVDGQSLARLGYKQGEVTRNGNCVTYHQKGYGDFFYDVTVEWKKKGETLYGTWSITSSLSKDKATEEVQKAMSRGLDQDYNTHMEYWENY